MHFLPIRYCRSHCKMLLTTNTHLSNKLDTTDAWSSAVSNQLVRSKEVTSPGFDFINLAVILLNARPETEFIDNVSPLHLQLARLIGSLVEETSSPLHLMVITEESLVNSINKVLKGEMGRHITTGVLLKRKPKTRFPLIRVTMVDIASVVEGHREHLDSMKQLFSRIESTLLLMPGHFSLLCAVHRLQVIQGEPIMKCQTTLKMWQ